MDMTNPARITFGEWLRNQREQRNWPMRRVAAQLDVDVSIISRMETGNRQPQRDYVEKLARIFDQDAGALLVLYLSDRVAYELAVGPIPDGRDLMHSCDVRHCVRPEHLRPATAQENAQDMVAKGRDRSGNEAKARCPAGHLYDEANTYINPTTGRRSCRKCQRSASVRYRARQRALSVVPAILGSSE